MKPYWYLPILVFVFSIMSIGTIHYITIDSIEYQTGYEDYPNDTIYKECLPYSYFAKSNDVMSLEWHPMYCTQFYPIAYEGYIAECDYYVDGWNQAAMEDYDEKQNNKSEIKDSQFEIRKNELIGMINNSSKE